MIPRSSALARLESFYQALNSRGGATLREDWTDHPLAQLNNPLGGILRGGEAVPSLYDRIFSGPVRVEVAFGDVVEYAGQRHVVFAGREAGTYGDRAGQQTPVEIRTTRYLRYEDGGWRQFHHHGSIDDAEALAAYQRA